MQNTFQVIENLNTKNKDYIILDKNRRIVHDF
jgi:hypothetical protein